MKEIRADLHIHTGLSPCASDEMTPPAIVQAALDRGLGMIAICDHNSAGNAAAAQDAASGRLCVLAGIEITSAEEVHVVGLFPDAASAEAAVEAVKATLPESTAASRKFGEQRLMDAAGRVVGRERKMLSGASTLGLSAGVALIKRHGGLAVAAHVDRPRFSVLSQLGLFPTDAGFDAVEVFSPSPLEGEGRGEGFLGGCSPSPLEGEGRGEGGSVGGRSVVTSHYAAWGLPVLASSDSHFLTEIARVWSVFRMYAATFEELALALRGMGGREVRCA
jgi:hypothetical protein